MEPLLALMAGLVIGLLIALTVVRARYRPVDEGGSALRSGPSDPGLTSDAALSRRLVDLMDPAVVLVGPDEAVLLDEAPIRAVLGALRDEGGSAEYLRRHGTTDDELTRWRELILA